MREMDRFQFKNGKLKMQRIGPLNPQRQKNFVWTEENGNGKLKSRNQRAPEKRGLWAFPYPLFDGFFASYQYQLALPKRFQHHQERKMFEQEELLLAQKQEGLLTAQEHLVLVEKHNQQFGVFMQEQEEYLASKTFRKKIQVREFWVSGSFYTHINLPTQKSPDESEWQLVKVRDFADYLPKLYAENYRYSNRSWMPGQDFVKLDNYKPTRPRGPWPLSVDHLEIFLGRDAVIH